MRFTCEEFVNTVRNNIKADLIPIDTRFNVFNKDEELVCDVIVDRTTVKYTGDHPTDLLVGEYTFVVVEE